MRGGGRRGRSVPCRSGWGEMPIPPAGPVDVLVVGAGPTGLTLAANLAAFGATVRVVDRRDAAARESRALVVQPRTLEVLRPLGVTQALLDRGDGAARVRLHLDGHEVVVPLSDFAVDDTSYPFLLVLRQAEVEAALLANLAARGLPVEWGAELLSYRAGQAGVSCTVRRSDGRTELVRARYLVGCDGADSTVRRHAGVEFKGGAYRRSVLLADIDIDEDLPGDAAHVFVGPDGVLVAFAAGEHAAWRLLLVEDHRPGHTDDPEAEVRAAAEGLSAGRVRARRVAWTARIPLQHRLAATFRSGRVFLAGDAAHVHSPAGAQGMNTGIQDASNLGWKLALTARGVAAAALLDTYGAERRPVARAVLALTHLAFWVETANSFPIRRARAALAPLAVPVGLRHAWLQTLAFRAAGQLWIRYPRGPAAVEGLPRLRRGPAAGQRLPDLPVLVDGVPRRLQHALATPAFQLLLCGLPGAWQQQQLERLQARYGRLVAVHRLGTEPSAAALCDPGGATLARLGVRNGAQYLVRPDGHVGYRCAGFDLDGLERHLHWSLPGGSGRQPATLPATARGGAALLDPPPRRQGRSCP
jgi:2-polyprenyl-6-methoxyphenol hydroxylase-like FAD-dependent oxidoreductase